MEEARWVRNRGCDSDVRLAVPQLLAQVVYFYLGPNPNRF
jgi:hypothetical protein